MDELIIRALNGDAEAIDRRRLAVWRDASVENERHYREIAEIWGASEPRAEDLGPTPHPPSSEAILRQAKAQRGRDSRRRLVRVFGRKDVWPWVLAASLAAVSLGMWIGNTDRAEPALRGTEFVAGRTEATTVALSDGSFIRLGPGSVVRFLGENQRRDAWLTGRAFFGVAADPDRPFVVHTEMGETRVLGTRFEVESQEGELRVAVVEGSVAVSAPGGRATDLNRGQVAHIRGNEGFSVTTVPDVYGLLDWPGGLLVFQETPVRQLAAEVAAHFGVSIRVEDAFASRTVTAWFGDEPLAEVVESVCLLIQAECEIGTDTVRIGQ